MVTVGIYIHIPFCRAKCAYCDFPSYQGMEPLYRRYVDALCSELLAFGGAHKEMRADTLYVGGGTPTALPPPLLQKVLSTCGRAFIMAPDAEVTVEANPGTVAPDDFGSLRAAGVNRLSLGVQSWRDEDLHLLGRIHTSQAARDAYESARSAGFDNINMDLIYGLPGQSLADWLYSLDTAVALAPTHLSLYVLSVEQATPLDARIQSGELPIPDPDLAADMYAEAEARLASAGYRHYELSNWAAEDVWTRAGPATLLCRHNVKYWRNQPYAGFGAAAHSCLDGCRFSNVGHPAEYVSRIEAGQSPMCERVEVGAPERMDETMILGLRMIEGVRFGDFLEQHGHHIEQEYGGPLAELRHLGLVDVDPDRVRLTSRGRLLANQVFVRFYRGPPAV